MMKSGKKEWEGSGGGMWWHALKEVLVLWERRVQVCPTVGQQVQGDQERSCDIKRPSMSLVHIQVCVALRAKPRWSGTEQLLAYGPALPSLPSLRPASLPLVPPSLDLPRVTEAAATAKANAVFIFVSVLCQVG